ncbi:hypothetical protein RB195_004767 [Necator americanus]|uniref:EndoU domain-containing protein n=1 Tax=Necator americanus TaxID=51031 RepID=A0ABR1BJK3_NECAM
MYLCVVLAATIVRALSQRLPPFDIKDAELLEFSMKLRDLDHNKARPGQIEIKYQDHTQSSDERDNAKERFFKKVDPDLFRKSSFLQLMAMMDNYNRQTGIAEPRTSVEEEKREIAAFLRTVLASEPFQKLFALLKQKGHPFTTSASNFRQWIEHLWFAHYSRAKGKLDTSGFEHVFMGEEKNNEVSGLHNWVRFYYLEKNVTENFDYKGFIVKRGKVMASLKFTWQKKLKRSGSILIGTSPEYDMALYTLCFLSRRGKELCKVEIDGCPLSITSYEMVQNGKVYIGTIYPTAGKMTNVCGMI